MSPGSWGVCAVENGDGAPPGFSSLHCVPRCSFCILSTLSHLVGGNGTSLHTDVDDWAIASQHILDPGGRIRGAEG